MIIFQAKYLKQLMPIVPENDIRYYLKGIYAEPHPNGGALLVATDGHMLVAIHDTEAICSEKMLFNVKKDAMKFCVQKSGNPAFVTVNSTTERLSLATKGRDGEELYIQPGKCLIESAEKYPNWKNLLPNFANLKSGFDDCISTELIRTVISSLPAKHSRHYSTSVRFWQESRGQATYMQVTQMPEIFVIIMPIREEHGDARPHWATMLKKPAKVEVTPVPAAVDPA